MSPLLFFEKAGCATNARQKQWLRNAGVAFEARDLRAEPWTRERLLAFFGALPVAEWFNRAAPQVKSGAVNPAALDADTALQLLLAEPLLIRRPLLQGNGWCAVGFDQSRLALLLGVPAAAAAGATAVADGVLEGCSHGGRAHAACPTPEAISA